MAATLMSVKMINQQGHHNKYYNMQQNDASSWTATYGRISQTVVTHRYPMSKWHQKYNEKLRHGYTDITRMTFSIGDVVRTPENREAIVIGFATAAPNVVRIELETGRIRTHNIMELSHAYLDPDLFLHQIFYPHLLGVYKQIKDSQNTKTKQGGSSV